MACEKIQNNRNVAETHCPDSFPCVEADRGLAHFSVGVHSRSSLALLFPGQKRVEEGFWDQENRMKIGRLLLFLLERMEAEEFVRGGEKVERGRCWGGEVLCRSCSGRGTGAKCPCSSATDEYVLADRARYHRGCHR